MMSHLKVRLIVALVAAATITSASTARAENKKKAFSDLLSPSIATATVSATSTMVAPTTFSSRVSPYSISAATVRPPGSSLAEYRALVYSNIFLNRELLFEKLFTLRSELRTGQISLAQFYTARQADLQLFYVQRAGLFTEFATGNAIPALTVIR